MDGPLAGLVIVAALIRQRRLRRDRVRLCCPTTAPCSGHEVRPHCAGYGIDTRAIMSIRRSGRRAWASDSGRTRQGLQTPPGGEPYTHQESTQTEPLGRPG